MSKAVPGNLGSRSRSSWGLVGLALLVAQAVVASGEAADVGVRKFEVEHAYHDQADSQGRCARGAARAIIGYEPADKAQHPLFVYLTGTRMSHKGPEAERLTEQMAKRGFVAASIEYDNRAYAYCSGMEAKARCLFGPEKSASAVAALCARKNVDCGRGVLLAGFSQGANLALLAKHIEPRVKGAYLLGLGHKAANFMDLTACMQLEKSGYKADEVRAVNGEHDGFFGATPEGVAKQLKHVFGATCASADRCLHPDGSGFYVIADKQLADHSADHCYFLNRADGFCAKYEGLDPGWEKGHEPWSMNANLDWLAARLKRP